MKLLKMLLSLALLSTFAWVNPIVSSASCAPPDLTTRAQRPVPGRNIQVFGKYYLDGCADGGSCTTTGCSGESVCDYGPKPQPMEDITLSLRRVGSHRKLPLTEVDAGETGRFSTTVKLPQDLKSGRYFVVDELGDPSELFRVYPRSSSAQVGAGD